MSAPHLTDQRSLSSSSSISDFTGELPIFEFTLVRNFLPITIGSNSGCFILAGMIALPDAISLLTNSAVTLFSELVKLFSLAAANSISLVIIPFFAYASWVTLSLNLSSD